MRIAANFLIQIDASVWFEESVESFFMGRVILKGSPVPVMISDAEMYKPKAILQQAQRAVNRARTDLPTPTITDWTRQSNLVSIIAQQIGDKPRLTFTTGPFPICIEACT